MKKLYEEASVQDIAAAIREKTGGAETYKIAQMGNAVRGITTGATITDGIVVKERNTDGYATVVDFYGTDIHVAQFYGGSAYTAAAITPFKHLTTINTKNAIKSIGSLGLAGLPNLQPQGLDLSHVQELDGLRFDTGANAETFPVHCPACTKLASNGCKGSGITSAELPELTEIGNAAFAECKRVKVISIPKITKLGQYTSSMFKGCVLLENVEVGSVGYPVASWGSKNFDGCTQSGLIVTLYTTGEKVDALNASIRDGATNATIIIKAAEDTTYNGATYAAGDTIITSTPEVAT